MVRGPVKIVDRLQFLRAGFRGLLAPVSLGVAAIATGPEGRVLLVRHTYRAGWYLPGGAVDRAEDPECAVMRELEEEVGLTHSAPPRLFGFYLRESAGLCDYIAVYTLKDVATAFRPNLEIAELCLADPAAPPEGTSDGAARRLAEFVNGCGGGGKW
jgi:8-oxo-dGTP pyrophosphatase MutT (NUDIX family)